MASGGRQAPVASASAWRFNRGLTAPARQDTLMSPDLIVMLNATFARPGGEPALRDVTWTVRDGETWAVVGSTGSGKTTLVNAAAGQVRVSAGHVAWPILDRARAAGKKAEWPGDVIRRLTFREDSRLFSYRGHYYQQRFEFGDDPDVPTVRQYLAAGTGAAADAVEPAAARLGIDRLLDLSLMKLSNGQTRRARLARALLAHPELLILDDPFVGLDVEGRADVAGLLGELVRTGQRLMLVCRPDQEPGWVTDVMELDEGRVTAVRRAGGVSPLLNEPLRVNQPGANAPRPPGREYVELHDVTVRHGGRTLHGGRPLAL